MPRHCQVTSLENHSLNSVDSLLTSKIVEIAEKIQTHSNPEMARSEMCKNLKKLSEQFFSHVPYSLHNVLAVKVLRSIIVPMKDSRLMRLEDILDAVISSYLKKITFSDWPSHVQRVLYSNLSKLNKIEILNMGFYKQHSVCSNTLLQGLNQMNHLTSICIRVNFDDSMVQLISANCLKIVRLNVRSSRRVTDKSVPHLLKCLQLKKLQLYNTGVSSEGIARILVGLTELEDIGKRDDYKTVIEHLCQHYPKCGPFNLKEIHSTEAIPPNQLRMLVDMFPKVSHFESWTIWDENCSNQFLRLRGNDIIILHILLYNKMNFNVLRGISQYCPQLINLTIDNCSSEDNLNVQTETLKVYPFFHLKSLALENWELPPLEFTLKHCVNLKSLDLRSCRYITHSFIEHILSLNPLEYLEELIIYDNNLNMRTVWLLLASCPDLKILFDLETWSGITKEELLDFRNYLRSHNYDLNTTPRPRSLWERLAKFKLIIRGISYYL